MRAMKVSFSGNLQCLKHLDHGLKRVLGEIDVSCDYPIVVLPTRWRGLCESSRFINSGPVIGMSLLLIVLLYKKTIPQSLESTAEGILSHLSLFFVPAGVGVVAHLTVLGNEWPAIVGSLIGSTIVTGWVLQRLHRGRIDET